MFVVVCYDIESNRKRTRLAKRLKDFGPRVQRSVFEAEITTEEFRELKGILTTVELRSSDSIRLYQICKECRGKITIYGKGDHTQDEPYYIT